MNQLPKLYKCLVQPQAAWLGYIPQLLVKSASVGKASLYIWLDLPRLGKRTHKTLNFQTNILACDWLTAATLKARGQERDDMRELLSML